MFAWSTNDKSDPLKDWHATVFKSTVVMAQIENKIRNGTFGLQLFISDMFKTTGILGAVCVSYVYAYAVKGLYGCC